MATLDWIILCERAVIEAGANNVSLISILENIQIPAPPPGFQPDKHAMVPMRFYVVQQWRRSKPKQGERVAGRTRLIGPKGGFGDQEFLVDLTGNQRGRIIAPAIGFPMQGPGLYRVVVEILVKARWKKVGESGFTFSYLDAKTQTSH